MSSEQKTQKVIASVEARAFKETGGFHLNYNSPVCEKLFADWPSNSAPRLTEYQHTGTYINSYDQHLRKRIETYDPKSFMVLRK